MYGEMRLRNVLQAMATVGIAGSSFSMTGTAASAAPLREHRTSIGVLLFDGYSLLDPTGPAEVLARLPETAVTMIGTHAGPIRTDTGDVAVVADRSLAEVDELDVLLVPGGGERGVTDAIADQRLIAWIQRLHQRTRWTVSVCTGSLILGAAGLLTGSQATTYWASKDVLSQYGAVYVAERYVQSGKIITAGGVAAGIDMALHLASLLHGDQVARAVQLAVEYDPQPPFDSGNPDRVDEETRRLALRLLEESQADR